MPRHSDPGRWPSTGRRQHCLRSRRPTFATRGPAGATYAEVPTAGLQAKNYALWNKDFGRWLSQSEKLELMRQRDLEADLESR